MDRIQVVLLVLVGIGVAWLAWQGIKRWLRQSIQAEAAAFGGEFPALLYFSSDTCAPCRLQQGPVIDSMRKEMGGRVRFVNYDVMQHADLARRYRVLTVPTTVVIAPCGDVVAVNCGLALRDKLQHQLDQADQACN